MRWPTGLVIPWLAIALATGGLASSTIATERNALLAAVRTRQADPAIRTGRMLEDPLVVEAVAEAICDVHANRPRCGSDCTSDRRDREHAPDRPDFVVGETECWDYARILVATAQEYRVPLDSMLAAAYQESRFREPALGSGTECGMFQQTTHHIRWNSEHVPGMARAPLSEETEICAYLLRLENAAWHFALKYHHERAQVGNNWPAYYNGGAGMWGYQGRHYNYRARFTAFIEDYAPQPAGDDASDS